MASVVIVGVQWGDEGKGKIVDALAGEAEYVVRFQGGDNAGHTVFHEDKKYVFHLLPSGMLRSGVLCIIGGGMVVNIRKLIEELKSIGLPETEWRDRLRISSEAHLLLPCHIAMDKYNEAVRGNAKIGTTLRGIGPAYADRASRTGVRMGDMMDKDYFRTQLDTCIKTKKGCLPKEEYQEFADVERAAEEILALAVPIMPLITDTDRLIAEAYQKKSRILFEGAQGTMLDVGAGTYPYVTSSHTIAGAVCVGAGVGPHYIDKILGVAKAYTTRVGEGPFPSELADETGNKLREIGAEYGATTRRPRRCGWLDIVQLKRAIRLNSLDGLILTKLDVLDDFDRIGVCTAYRCGERRYSEIPVNPSDMNRAIPEIEYMPGWKCSTESARSFKDLPEAVQNYIIAIEKWLGVPVTMVSAGKDRSQLIIRRPAF